MLDLAERVVVDAPLVAEADGRIPFDLRKLPRQVAITDVVLRVHRLALLRCLAGEAGEPLAIVRGEVMVDGGEIGPVARARLFQVPQSGFDRDASGLPLLAGGSRRALAPQQPDQRR